MAEVAILFDSSRCSACKACQISCKQWNSLPSPLKKNARPFTGSYQSPIDLNGDTRLIITFSEAVGGTNGVEWAFGRRSCYHCSEPACVDICPSGALSKQDNGVVKLDASVCIGCRYCTNACPFSVPKFREAQNHVDKCTFCADRLEQGRKPACVQTCQPGALEFGDRDEMLALAKERLALLQSQGYDRAVLYGENEMGGLHVLTIARYGIEAIGLPANPQTSPMVSFMQLLKPITGIGVGAVVAGLGISFLSGIGYKRDEMVYDEDADKVVKAVSVGNSKKED